MQPLLKKQILDAFQQSYNAADVITGSAHASDFDKACRSVLEQPQQLEEVIREVLPQLLDHICGDFKAHVFSRPHYYYLLYSLIDVRGLRFMTKYFNNEVSLLEPCLSQACYLTKMESITFSSNKVTDKSYSDTFSSLDISTLSDHLLFRARFVVFFWLSILVLTPFNIQDIDSDAQLKQNLIQACMAYKTRASKLTQMANEVLARFCDRSDCEDVRSSVILEANKCVNKCCQAIVKNRRFNAQELCSYIQLLSLLQRFSSSGIIHVIENPENIRLLLGCQNREIRKITSVLCSRVASQYLKRQFNWMEFDNTVDALEEVQEFDVPEEFDMYVDGLLVGLSDTDPFCRQTSAFGLAAILRKLPKLFADEVLQAVLDICSPAESPESWNGALICIAEMLRQRLVLKQSMSLVISIIVQGFQNHFTKLGNIVRDACCFCAWSLARSYSGEEIGNDSVVDIAANLLALSCLDRDISIRRCAAAAFQEMAGRLKGKFVPEAIKCASLVDYYQLGDVEECYQKIAPQICSLNRRYREVFVRYLSELLVCQQQQQRQQVSKLIAAIYDPVDDEWLEIEVESVLGQTEDFIQFTGACVLLGHLVRENTCKNLGVIKSAIVGVIKSNSVVHPNQETQQQLVQNFCYLVIAYSEHEGVESLKQDADIEHFCFQNLAQSIRYYFGDMAIQNYSRIFENLVPELMRLIWKDQEVDVASLVEEDLVKCAVLCALSRAQIHKSPAAFLEVIRGLLDKHKSASDNVMRLFLIRAIRDNFEALSFDQDYIKDLNYIIQVCINDFSTDSRGEVGCLVRHQTYQTLREICRYQFNNGIDNSCSRELVMFYTIATTQFVCNRIETLRLLAIRSFFDDTQTGLLKFKNIDRQLIQSYIHLQELEQTNGRDDAIFDMGLLTSEELKKKIDQADYEIVQNSYKLIEDVFLVDKRVQFVAYRCLIQNITFCSADELQHTIDIFTKQTPDFIYGIILKIFEKVTNRGYEGATQYSCILLTNYLSYHGFLVPQSMQHELLINKISAYIDQTQINFQAFQTAFSIFSLYAQRNKTTDQGLTVSLLKILLNNLTNKTVKIRDQAFDALLEFLMYAQNLDDSVLQQVCQYEWMLAPIPKAVKQRAELVDLCGLSWAVDPSELLE